MNSRTVAAGAGVAGGLLWIAAWLHLLVAHGTTEVNETRIVLGLTWLDSGRLIAPALVLIGLALVGLARLAKRPAVTMTVVVSLVGVALGTAGIALGFWTQPFGTYVGASRETGFAAIGGALAIIGSLVLAVGLVAFAVAAARERVLPAWLSIVIAAGALSAIPWLYEAPQGVLFGIAWVLVGGYLAVHRPLVTAARDER